MLTKCDRIKAQKTPEKALSEVCFPKAKFINSVKVRGILRKKEGN